MDGGKWGRRSSDFSLTGAHVLTHDRRARVVDCRPLSAQTGFYSHMPLTLLTDHTAFSYPKALDIDMGTPVLSLPEITNVREWWAIVGMLAVLEVSLGSVTRDLVCFLPPACLSFTPAFTQP